MILCRSDDAGDGLGAPGELRVVTQSDHAALAAEILALWRRDGLPEHPRRAELLFATREHDNGWREADSAPHHDAASGRPHDFMSLPQAARREIWCRGVDRYWEERPYAALLVLRHAIALHRERAAADSDWHALVDAWRGREAERLAELEVTEETLRADHRWLDLADTLSLAVAAGWEEPFERAGYRVVPGATSLALDPFSLAGATRFRLACRTIPDRTYTSDSDLALELAGARWRQVAVAMRPG